MIKVPAPAYPEPPTARSDFITQWVHGDDFDRATIGDELDELEIKRVQCLCRQWTTLAAIG